ncbi:GNAT family N-acetyltransferase [Dongia soli]|uniref:GNAT family N-acetyltransferase n=1 Tax=Dongia soli TaxID=600628 RepID=A0ABU5EEN1_9PROT|nr:GNAT family N-acetyltransferase [Dongia soli]MDY0884834.1 GNAT family N-acetyltransferase [Dongia soli]
MAEQTMPAITMRPAIATDHENLRVALVALQEYERLLHDTRLPAETFVDRYLRWMLQQVSEQNGLCLIAEADNAFAGFVAGWIERMEWMVETADSTVYGYISDIFVLPDWRGQRVATRLLDAAAAHMRDRGMARLRIGLLSNNVAAIAAYRYAGFQPYEMTMEKALR